MPDATQRLRDGETISLPHFGIELTVLEVPGHTRSHIAYFSKEHDILFCGDTLFAAGCGRLFEGTADVEASVYPTRRFGVGIKAGGGIAMAPLLIAPDEYSTTVVTTWGGVQSLVNGNPLPMFGGGPTIEYYTKLSHFSVGLDVDVNYFLTLNDLGITPNGYMKYTF